MRQPRAYSFVSHSRVANHRLWREREPNHSMSRPSTPSNTNSSATCSKTPTGEAANTTWWGERDTLFNRSTKYLSVSCVVVDFFVDLFVRCYGYRFYKYFEQFKQLRIWKMQLLDESHLLIKYANEKMVTLSVLDPNTQPAFFVVYNFIDATVTMQGPLLSLTTLVLLCVLCICVTCPGVRRVARVQHITRVCCVARVCCVTRVWCVTRVFGWCRCWDCGRTRLMNCSLSSTLTRSSYVTCYRCTRRDYSVLPHITSTRNRINSDSSSPSSTPGY